jgi:hypothetical protein
MRAIQGTSTRVRRDARIAIGGVSCRRMSPSSIIRASDRLSTPRRPHLPSTGPGSVRSVQPIRSSRRWTSERMDLPDDRDEAGQRPRCQRQRADVSLATTSACLCESPRPRRSMHTLALDREAALPHLTPPFREQLALVLAAACRGALAPQHQGVASLGGSAQEERGAIRSIRSIRLIRTPLRLSGQSLPTCEAASPIFPEEPLVSFAEFA